MKKLIYLSNGQQAELQYELPDGKFLVDPIFSYQDYNSGEWLNLPSSGFQVVDKIFNSPPIEKISKEVSELLEQKKSLITENSKIKQDTLTAKMHLQQLETKVQDISKWQIDLSKWKNCKTIHFFIEGDILPHSINKPKYSSDWYELRWTIKAGVKDELKFNLTVQTDGYSDRQSKIDEEYGYIFDLTQDEVDSIALERISKMDLSNYDSAWKFKNIPERFMTGKLKELRDIAVKSDNEKSLAAYNKQIEDLKEKIKAIS